MLRILITLLLLSAHAAAADQWFVLGPVDRPTASAHVAAAKIDGLSIRARWRTIEPVNDQFDFAFIDGEIATARRHKKSYMLRIMAGDNAPPHSYKSLTHNIPTPWEEFHATEFDKLAAALANRYSADSSLFAVHVPGFDKSAEMHLPPGNWPTTRMREAWLHRIKTLARLFPCLIAINHSPEPFSAGVITDADQLLGNRAAFQMNALKASTNTNWTGYTTIVGLGQSGKTTGWQFVGPSTNGGRFGGPFSTAVAKGQASHPAYWEIYRPDISRIPE